MQAQLVDSPDLLVLRTPQQPSNHHHQSSTWQNEVGTDMLRTLPAFFGMRAARPGERPLFREVATRYIQRLMGSHP